MLHHVSIYRASRRLGLSPLTTRRKIAQRLIPVVVVAGQRRVPLEYLEKVEQDAEAAMNEFRAQQAAR